MIIRKTPRFARREIPSRSRGGDDTRELAQQIAAFRELHSASKAFRRIEILEWLMDEYDFAPEHAEAIATRLLESGPALRGAFLRWWVTGKIDDVEVEGYRLDDLVRKRHMHPIGALLALSLLTIDPERARLELERIEGGEKPGGVDPDQIARLVTTR
jgi:hypothetical protein